VEIAGARARERERERGIAVAAAAAAAAAAINGERQSWAAKIRGEEKVEGGRDRARRGIPPRRAFLAGRLRRYAIPPPIALSSRRISRAARDASGIGSRNGGPLPPPPGPPPPPPSPSGRIGSVVVLYAIDRVAYFDLKALNLPSERQREGGGNQGCTIYVLITNARIWCAAQAEGYAKSEK